METVLETCMAGLLDVAMIVLIFHMVHTKLYLKEVIIVEINFLNNYAVPTIIGICLCTGYVIKNSLQSIKNRYIPLIMVTIGIILNIWINKSITPDILLAGMFSGLASTGLHQAFKQLIGGSK